MTSTCPFCQIASGNKPARIVHQSDRFIAFEPITKATGKLLIVPIQHYEKLADIRIAELGAWMQMAHDLADMVDATSYKVQINVGSAYQNVRHLYMQFSYTAPGGRKDAERHQDQRQGVCSDS